MSVVQDLWKSNQIKLMTIGQVRIGNVAYSQSHDAKVPYSYRIVHKNDIGAHIPPKMGNDPLFHHRFEVWYDNDMEIGASYTICNRPDDDSCSNTQADLSLFDHNRYFSYNLTECCQYGCPPR